jgi:hypothetical protein
MLLLFLAKNAEGFATDSLFGWLSLQKTPSRPVE